MRYYDPGTSVSAGIAVARAIVARKMYKLQIKLLKAQLDLSEKYLAFYTEQRAFYRSYFRDDVNIKLIQLAQDPLFTPKYFASYGSAFSIVSDRMAGMGYLVFGSYISPDPYDNYYQRRATMYSLPTPVDVSLVSYIAVGRCAIFANALNGQYRYEEYKENIYQQRRYERLMVLGEMSNSFAIAASRDGASSFAYLNDALDRQGNYYGSLANEHMAASGQAFQTMRNLKNAPAETQTGAVNRYVHGLEQSLQKPFWDNPFGPVLK